MALKRTKLLHVQSITGVATVGIFTVGVTQTPVGIASTTYLRSVIMHNTGLSTATSSIYIYPSGESVTGVGQTQYRIFRYDISSNETLFFETVYPLVLTDQDKIVFEITPPAAAAGGAGVGTAINVQLLGDTE